MVVYSVLLQCSNFSYVSNQFTYFIHLSVYLLFYLYSLVRYYFSTISNSTYDYWWKIPTTENIRIIRYYNYNCCRKN